MNHHYPDTTADTHLKLQERVDSGACFLTGGLFECNTKYGSFMIAVWDQVWPDAPSLWCYTHGLKNNTKLTRFFNPTKKKSVRWRHCQEENGGPSVLCLAISRNAFVSRRIIYLFVSRCKSGVNRHLVFCQFLNNSEVCRVGCVLFIKPWHHTLHISDLKYAPTHGTFPSFLEIDKTAGAYWLQIYDYLSQIQRETYAFLLIVWHNTEGPPFSAWQWRHRTRFFFIGLKYHVNLVLFFKPWPHLCRMLYSAGAGYSKLPKAAWAKGHSIHRDGCAKIRHTYLNR